MLLLAYYPFITSVQSLSNQGNKFSSTALLTHARISAAGIEGATVSNNAVAVEDERPSFSFGLSGLASWMYSWSLGQLHGHHSVYLEAKPKGMKGTRKCWSEHPMRLRCSVIGDAEKK